MENQSEEFKTTSPLPEIIEEGDVLMDFPNAMKEVIEGRKVTRLEWKNPEIYCLLKDTYLTIHINGEFKNWIVNDGDMLGTDWTVI
jgi:hypothetical protein